MYYVKITKGCVHSNSFDSYCPVEYICLGTFEEAIKSLQHKGFHVMHSSEPNVFWNDAGDKAVIVHVDQFVVYILVKRLRVMKNMSVKDKCYKNMSAYFDWDSYWNDAYNKLDFKSHVKKFKKTSCGYVVRNCAQLYKTTPVAI